MIKDQTAMSDPFAFVIMESPLELPLLGVGSPLAMLVLLARTHRFQRRIDVLFTKPSSRSIPIVLQNHPDDEKQQVGG